MKLNSWSIQQALSAADWDAAVAALAAEFGLPLPTQFRIDVIRDGAFIPEVELYVADKRYHWNIHNGFFVMPSATSKQIFADIYLPQCFP